MMFFAQLRSELRSWWKALFHRTRIEGDIEEELQFHIHSYTQQLVEGGVPEQEARRKAKAEFGRVDVQKEKYRSAIGLRPLHEIGGDVRYGLRSLYRNRAVSLVAVLSLALGIGATTAIFSVVYDALLHPYPYAGADRIVNPAVINEEHPQTPTWFALTPSQYESFSKANSIDSVLGFMPMGLRQPGASCPKMCRRPTSPAIYRAFWVSRQSWAGESNRSMWRTAGRRPMSSFSPTNTGRANTAVTERSSDECCS